MNTVKNTIKCGVAKCGVELRGFGHYIFLDKAYCDACWDKSSDTIIRLGIEKERAGREKADAQNHRGDYGISNTRTGKAIP